MIGLEAKISSDQLNDPHRRIIRVEVWRDLVLPKTKPSPDNKTIDVYAFHDPVFKQPWLLAASVKLTYQSVYAIYTDPWPIVSEHRRGCGR